MNLDKSYNRSDFLRFIKSFIPDFKLDITRVDEEGLKVSSDVSRLGESSDLDLDVFELSHSASTNARITLASDGFRIMKNAACYRALIVYEAEDNQDWRLSLLTATPVNKKGKVKQEYSNPRRYSFFLGPNAKTKTPKQFLIKKGAVNNFEDLQNRFSIEVVNKEFYQHISTSYEKLVGGTIGSGRKQENYKAVMSLPSQEPHSQTSVEFAVRLIGRIIFCWFLREKKSQSGKSLIPEELISLKAVKDNPDYYHKILEPIFFEILNKPTNSRKEKYREKPFLLIPYLNGGLFSPQKDDFYDSSNEGIQAINHNIVIVPDRWFLELFEVLESYNFTIDEDTAFDEELSIDPEMLGRIFENLLAEINPETGESARKSTGSYYTPRMIVDFMINESLIVYLNNKTGIDRCVLQNLVDYDFSKSKNRLSKLDNVNIVKALDELTLIDPACGSGAFPIGAMQKIVFILQQIDPDNQLWLEKQLRSLSPELRQVVKREQEHFNFDYIRKLGIIQNNIYGVDIQPIATEISRLRCFLTLIVEQSVDDIENNRNIQPLPNLEFKFVTANSLVGLPKENNSVYKQKQLEMYDNRENINELKYIREQYFTSSGIEREQLKAEFISVQKKLIDQLINEHDFMSIDKAQLTQKLYRWEPFSHKASDWFNSEWMFGVKNGFDIVIGNPPYYQLSKDKTVKEEYKAYLREKYKTSGGRQNLFIYFTHLSLNILRINGVLALIIPNTILSQEYYKETREKIIKETQIESIVTYQDMQFENAVVENISLILSKRNSETYKVHLVSLINTYFETYKKIPVEYFSREPYFRFSIHSRPFVEELFNMSTPLNSICNINQAIALKGDKSLSVRHEKKEGYYKLLDGRNINKYAINWTGEFLDYDIERIHSCKTKDIFLFDEKLLFRRVSENLVFTYDNQQYFALNTIVVVTLKNILDNKNISLKFLLALLNSSLLNFIYISKFKSTKTVFSEIQARSIGELPIKIPKDQAPFINYSNEILDLKKRSLESDTSLQERQIDNLVYELYNLTAKEIAIVEESIK